MLCLIFTNFFKVTLPVLFHLTYSYDNVLHFHQHILVCCCTNVNSPLGTNESVSCLILWLCSCNTPLLSRRRRKKKIGTTVLLREKFICRSGWSHSLQNGPLSEAPAWLSSPCEENIVLEVHRPGLNPTLIILHIISLPLLTSVSISLS